MIQANELRIGNWFQWEIGKYVQVDSISEHGVGAWLDSGPDEWAAIQWEDLSNALPIPLTPEILEKAGFERRGLSIRKEVNRSDELCWFYQDPRLKYQTQGSGFTRDYNIKYLHQLQNLYFALTGNELSLQF